MSFWIVSPQMSSSEPGSVNDLISRKLCERKRERASKLRSPDGCNVPKKVIRSREDFAEMLHERLLVVNPLILWTDTRIADCGNDIYEESTENTLCT